MKIQLKRRQISYLVIIIVELLLTLFAQLLSVQPFSLIAIINALSVVSLVFLTIGLVIFVIHGGFFDGIVYSFKRFSRDIRKNRLGEADAEAPLAEYRKRDGQRPPLTWPLIWISFFLFCLSLVLSVFI
ncbi:DUF3899 domain-containing protein [Sporolactobacillus putidus]|uniref:DUF3899 domain-containing protein n=1 Tax=Sporolactobacillus putidus TaxID=492735 RepID=A0A917W032_9BACL|nr:DUF3899 domain-containing protein [Sporolactobacillus putidus]GGL45826.1 hypothetical protein GCM10007968_07420 [Sporolactobacillus putidus]